MREVTRVAIVVLAAMLGLWACEKEGAEEEQQAEQQEAEGSAAQPRERQTQTSFYEAAELSPQERLERNLRGIYDVTLGYFLEERLGAGGEPTHMFPGSAPRTPARVPCGEPAAVDPADWSQPTWRALHFNPQDPLYYSYEYTSQGTGLGATFTVTAYGDLDCDGVLSTFMRRGTGQRGGAIYGTMESIITNPDE